MLKMKKNISGKSKWNLPVWLQKCVFVLSKMTLYHSYCLNGTFAMSNVKNSIYLLFMQ